MDLATIAKRPDVRAAAAKSILARLPPRFSDNDLTPANLASLLSLAAAVWAEFPALHEALTDRLIDVTVSKAVRGSPFYQQSLGISPDLRVDARLLATLPFLSRALAQEAGTNLRSSEQPYGFSTFTGGTTSNRRLIIDRSYAEESFVREFSKLITPKPASTRRRLGLRLVNNWHGKAVELGNPTDLLHVGASSFDTAAELLARDFGSASDPLRICRLIGPLAALLRLTAFLARRHTANLPDLEYIETGSEYLTPRARRVLSAFWNCPIHDRFGVTESLLASFSCTKCKAYHFEPWGYAEVVGLASDQRISRGAGRLVLTTYYPWVQLSPFLRYLTGDIVEIVSETCPTGRLGIIPHGRMARCATDGDELLLSDFQVFTVLDEEPDVAKADSLPTLPPYLRSTGFNPAYRHLEPVNGRHGIEVKLLYDPFQFPERAEELKRRLEQNLEDISGHACFVHLITEEGR